MRKAIFWSLVLMVSIYMAPVPAGASGGIVPPNNPQANFPTPWQVIPCTAASGPYLCTVVGGHLTWTTTRIERFYLEAIDQARASEGLGPLALPVDFAVMSPTDQLYALLDAERSSRGLPPIYGTSSALTASAQAGVALSADPSLPPDLQGLVSGWGSVWDDSSLVLRAWFMWMYDDTWGGSPIATPNLSCTGPGQQGCWGHRDVLLGDFGPQPVVGAAVGPMSGTSQQQASAPGATLIIAASSAALDVVPLPQGTGAVTSDPNVLFPPASPPIAGSLPQPAPVPSSSFTDVADVPWAGEALNVLHLAGVVLGVGKGLFNPEGDVSWAEAATMAGRLFRFPPRPQYAPRGSPAWASGSLGYAIEHGYVPQGSSPGGVVSRGTFLAVLAAASGAGASPAAWSASGLLGGLSGGPDLKVPLTRAQAAVFLYRAVWLAKPHDVGSATVRFNGTLDQITLYGPQGNVYRTSYVPPWVMSRQGV